MAGTPTESSSLSTFVPRQVPEELVRQYREQGWWGRPLLREGIELAASRTPGSVAVVDDHRQVTWAELADLTDAAVRCLEEAGVGSGRHVLLVGGNTVEAVVGYHAVLRSGATAVLLDRRCGATDVRWARDALPIDLVVAPSAVLDRLHGEVEGLASWDLDEFGRESPGVPEGIAWSEPDRSTPAVVLFTSGTTGRPKAVVHSLDTLTSGARNMGASIGADHTSVLYLVSPLTSITGIIQMHVAAACHGTLVLDDSFEAEGSLDRVNRMGATVLGGAPVIIERLVEVADRRGDGRLAIRTLAVGGSMLTRSFLERLRAEYGVDVIRIYGSSEFPVATGRVEDDDPSPELVDDGSLMPGTEVRTGSSAHPQEGLLRGPALFLGYLDPEDNDQAFEDGWYRTGDMVELTGTRLTVAGRLKEIVNRNGLKISLSEIDAAMHGLPGIVECASFSLPDPQTGERLAVAVVVRSGETVSLEDVTTHLRSSGLATRKLPEQLFQWNGPLPRNPSGKIIRAELVEGSSQMQSTAVERLR